MGLPQINIVFEHVISTLVERSNRGVVTILLKDDKALGITELIDKTEIPNELSEENKIYIEQAFIGNVTSPNKVILYVIGEEDTLEKGLSLLETVDFNYICMPEATEAENISIKNWIIKRRNDYKSKVKAVLANCDADNEGIINYTTDVTIDKVEIPAENFTPRIAGLIAGTPLSQSVTYAILPEVTDITKLDKDTSNTKIGNGELILIKECGAVRIARGVNSLKQAKLGQTESFKKIKLIDVMDLIHNDIKKIIIDGYSGKVANSYDNKCLLLITLLNYLDEITKEELIERNYTLDIDIEKQRKFLNENGINTTNMKELDIKKANTGAKVFLKGKATTIDAMEDFYIDFDI